MGWPKGRPKSPETRKRISLGLLGNVNARGNTSGRVNAGQRRPATSRALRGRTLSADHRAAISRGLRENIRHGHARAHNYSPTYVSWRSMLRRCENPHDKNYSRYGGRGIRVIARWHVFENFLADMGARPKGKTLDRKNPNGDYSKRNCRWATPFEQTHNRRAR